MNQENAATTESVTEKPKRKRVRKEAKPISFELEPSQPPTAVMDNVVQFPEFDIDSEIPAPVRYTHGSNEPIPSYVSPPRFDYDRTESVIAKCPPAPEPIDVGEDEYPGVVDQIKTALLLKNLPWTIFGCVVGGMIPAFTYQVSHHELVVPTSDNIASMNSVLFAIVAGSLLFSAITVSQWSVEFFRSQWVTAGKWKAFGFVVAVEGYMTFSKTEWVGYCALALLVVINGIATGVNLTQKHKRDSWYKSL